MRIRKYFFLFLFFTAVFLLNSCNLGISKPELNIPPTLLSDTPTIPPNTITPMASLTPTPFATLIPTATVTLFYDPTITSTPQWSVCPGIVITQMATKKGYMLHVLRCEDGLKYDLGPLAKGVYAVGPNNKFFVYVSVNGLIFAARIGDKYLNNLYNLGHEHIYTVFNKKVAPDFQISFAGEEPFYRLVLVEKNYNQKRAYELPIGITH